MMFVVRDGLAEEWAEVGAEAPFLASQKWLRAREGRTDGETFTFLIDEAAGLFGTLIADGSTDEVFNLRKLLHGSPRTILMTPGQRTARSVVEELSPPEEEWFPNLVVVFPGYECFPVGPKAASEEVVEELVAGIVEWASEQQMKSLSFLYTSPDNQLFDGILSRQKLQRVHLTYTCDLRVEGDGFEDYLQMLPRKRRTEVRREIRHLSADGIETVQRKVEECFDDLVRLRLVHSAKYGRRVSEEKEVTRLRGLIDNFGHESLTVFGSMQGSQMVSFTLFLDYRGVWYAVDSGGTGENAYAYFDTSFYSPVAAAYERGISLIRYSMGAWEAKTHRGCDLVPRQAWILPLVDALRPVFDKAEELLVTGYM